MGVPRGRQPIADDLQPERHGNFRSALPLVHGHGFPTPNHKAVANFLAHCREKPRRTKVHGHRPVHGLADLAIAENVLLRDGRFEYDHVFVALEPLYDRNGIGRVLPRAVGIEIEMEMRGHHLGYGVNLSDDVVPGSRFVLEVRVPLRHGLGCFRGPVLRRGVTAPPRNRRPVAHFGAQQPMHRDFEYLADHVEQRHLQTSA